MPSTHRTYVKDFRQEAVNLLLSSGRPLKRVAAELGVTPNSLRTYGLVVIEAPQSGGYSTKIIDLLAHHFPKVPIKALVSTTDTTFHYAGVRTYAARGIPIYALSFNTPLLQQLMARSRTFVPDELSQHPRKPILRDITGRVTIGTGKDRMELYPIGGSGNARMMMIYFPSNRLLYGSSNDLNLAQGRVTFNMFELVRRVDELKLPVEDFVGIHTSKVSWQKIRHLALTDPPIG
jgi:transposase